MRATELVKLLSLEKSVRGAIKLVTALKLPNLAERFNSILEVSPTDLYLLFIMYLQSVFPIFFISPEARVRYIDIQSGYELLKYVRVQKHAEFQKMVVYLNLLCS